MGEEISDTMNLDLNLGPAPEPQPEPEPTSGLNETVNLEERMVEPIRRPAPELVSFSTAHEPVNLDEWGVRPHRIMEGVRLSGRHRWRWPHDHISPEAQNISMELNQLMVNSGNASNILQAGEGGVAAGGRTSEVTKTCENGNGILEEETSENKDEIERGSGSGSDGSFFDCNICLDLARDPVVTCCGHLFCWSCIYRWLHVHSDAKECPVCKGEVTQKNVTPIYGRGNHICEPDEDSSLKIPPRPQGRRVESVRQTIQRTAFPVEDMIRILGSRFDLTRDLIQSQEPTDSAVETAERASLLNRILTSSARRENNVAPPTDDAVDLMQSSFTTPDAGENLRLLLLRRTITQRTPLTSLSSQLNAERLVETYFRSHPTGRNQQEQPPPPPPPPPPVDDRDSFSSIAAVINSESQIDTAVEIDSVSLSTSSSRRRTDASRISDVDSGDSRAPRRRRLN